MELTKGEALAVRNISNFVFGPQSDNVFDDNYVEKFKTCTLEFSIAGIQCYFLLQTG